ncbi:MAG TPA: DEAD/DEAH box helicase [Bacteroidia bacterium]|jgi:ATP-independent RNA helicase DbpA|nr:DEAD/DEAH box helicase [Bacteroidia bacterium]
MTEQVLRNLGITALNEMQLASLKALEKGKDLVLLSPTGSGKTLGFLLPVLKSLKKDTEGVQVLILVPARELAIQIESVFRSMGTGFKVNCCYGGHSTKTERNNLLQAPAVLIGTPGRIAHHLRRESFRTDHIHTLVLDEFDKSLEFGFKAEMSAITEALTQLKTRILTSATDLKTIPDFVGMHAPAELNYLTHVPVSGLELKMVKATGKDKLEALFGLICKIGNKPSLVFCNHRDAVERISEILASREIAHGVFHGGMEQDERERSLIKFRNGSHHLLITTDLASRGLDIPAIENVIHYQLAPTENVFVHRNGRTARMKAEGTAYLVLGAEEYVPSYITEPPVEETLPSKQALPEPSAWNTLYLNAGKKEKINKVDIVGLLLQKGGLQKDELGLIEVLDHCSFVAVKRGKIASVLQLLRDEKIKKKSVKISIAG